MSDERMATGVLMPNGEIRPAPPWLLKPQAEWTEAERTEALALQADIRAQHEAIQRERTMREKFLAR